MSEAGRHRTLFEHACWADARVLDAAARVAESDYFAEVPGLSYGSLHATLVHQLVGNVVWLARWRGVEPPDWGRDARAARRVAAAEVTTFADLRARWTAQEHALGSFFTGLTDQSLERRVAYRMVTGDRFEDPLHEQIAHVLTHGMHYRAEAAVRLTALGQSPAELDLILFLRLRAGWSP